MFKKKECYLCGGKLINGRCSSCGLDNTKLEKKNYRLNESSFDRKKKMTYFQKRQNETGETKKREKKQDAGHLCESHNGRKRTQIEYQQKENPRIKYRRPTWLHLPCLWDFHPRIFFLLIFCLRSFPSVMTLTEMSRILLFLPVFCLSSVILSFLGI